MPSHTPGPWTCWDAHPFGQLWSANIGSHSASGGGGPAQAYGGDKEEAEANAHLIAEAPSMKADLEMALTELVTLIPRVDARTRPNLQGAVDRIKATLKRTEGRAP